MSNAEHDLIGDESLEDAAERLNVKLIGFERGGPCLNPDHGNLHICAVCWHHTEASFVADSDTHRILNRSLNPIKNVGLCVRCWGDLIKD